MNKCVACHADGSFRLDRVSIGGQQVASRNNMNMVLAYLDVEKPAQSPLLVKAVEAHGGATLAPLKDRKEVPAQILQDWIEQTIALNPSVKEHHAAKKPAKRSDEPKTAKLPAPTNVGPLVLVSRNEIAAEPKRRAAAASAAKQPQAQLDYLQAMARKQPLPPPVQKIAGSLQQQIIEQAVEPSIAQARPRSDPATPVAADRPV